MTIAIIGLGGNLAGPLGAAPAATLEAAIAGLGAIAGLSLVARSRLWDSAAWPDASGPRYVNAVAVLEGDADPEALLARLHAMEAEEGRVRGAANAARPLDLDLLALGGLVRPAPDPVLPHPRLHQRRFVLAPLAEIMPDWRHPILARRAADLLADLPPADCRPIA